MPTAHVNGIKYYYEDHGKGDAFVMLHGATGTSRNHEAYFPELSKRFRVIAPDNRGLGQSEHVSRTPANAYVEDLRALLDHLNIQKAHIYGTSLGARVALRFAIDYPDRVRSLVLNNPMLNIEEGGNAAMNNQITNMSPAAREEACKSHGDDYETVLKNYFTTRNDPAFQNYLDLREACKQVTAPTLVIRSDVDEPIHPLAHSFQIKAKVPNTRLAIIPIWKPGAGRVVIPPATIIKLIDEFVATLEPVPAR